MVLKMKILSSEFVRPSSPTKDGCKKYHLSLLDELIPDISLPLLLYYHRHEYDHVDNFSSRLRESLSDALTMFYPLAGRLKRDETSVDCNDMGVRYSEAEVDSKIADVIEAGRLEPKLLDPLMIPISFMHEDHNSLLLAIQINYFNCGGIAVGARMAHKIADACSYVSFMATWATLARKGNVTPPSLISSSLFPPSNEKSLLRSLCPPSNEHLLVEIPDQDREIKHVTRRFVFDERMISYLRAKSRVDIRPDMMEPTRVGAVSAFVWKHSSSGGGPEKQYMMALGVNLRPRMVPPLGDHVFGNLVVTAFAIASHQEFDQLGIMAGNLREGIDVIDDKYIRWYGLEGGYATLSERSGEQLASDVEASELFVLSSWCRFPVYEIDFGMGKPIWVGFANGIINNSVFLMDAKFGHGLEAWITMPHQNLTKFELAFKEAIANNNTA